MASSSDRARNIDATVVANAGSLTERTWELSSVSRNSADALLTVCCLLPVWDGTLSPIDVDIGPASRVAREGSSGAGTKVAE